MPEGAGALVVSAAVVPLASDGGPTFVPLPTTARPSCGSSTGLLTTNTTEVVPDSLEPSPSPSRRVVVDDDDPSTRSRATAAQVRRAAGSQSLDKLKEALAGWTRRELDLMASQDGKNAVHMAAWQGCVDNLTHLLDDVGCCVDTIATGPYSYGKTPLFFAATRCRDDVVELLLQRGAAVKIVNNKGQSVRSIASSHLKPATVELVEKAEHEQHHRPWVNYRRTHSDGLEYGDLDPRFFVDRELRHDDVVTARAVNPTTKQSRRGSFLRRNPHLQSPSASQHRSAVEATTKAKRKHPKPKDLVLSDNQTQQLHEAWQVLQTLPSDENESGKALLTILRLHGQVRRPWIQVVAAQLSRVVSDPDRIDRIVASATAALELREGEDAARLRPLLDRVRTQARHPSTSGQAAEKYECAPSPNRGDSPRGGVAPSPGAVRRRKTHPTLPLSSPVWREACRIVSDLSLRVFMLPPVHDSGVLRLDRPPVWVDSIDAVEKLRDHLASVPLVAFDTEWSDAVHLPGSSVISTLQLAVNDECTWIIDLAQCQGESDEPQHRRYQVLCREVVQSLFETKVLLGFALGRDIAKLEEWLGRPLCLRRCLDLQHYFSLSRHNVPGLATCARQVLIGMADGQDTSLRPPAHMYHLDKSQQCSDWSRRPLTPLQLSYAALDAAILPFLLAEQARISRAKGDEM